MVPGTGAGAAVVPLGAENLHPAREFLNALQERVLSAGLPTLAISGREMDSTMRSAQRVAASNLTSGWPARAVCTLCGSRLHQVLRREYSGRSRARLLRCLRNCDGLRSPISSCVMIWPARCSLVGDSRFCSSVFGAVYGSFPPPQRHTCGPVERLYGKIRLSHC
jgi:hypothetical protein